MPKSYSESSSCFLCGSIAESKKDVTLSNGLICHALCASALSKRFEKRVPLQHFDPANVNKIKGDLAERICYLHFTTLGYSVDRLGIEQIAKAYLSISPELGEGAYLETNFSSIIRALPDFLVSFKYIDGYSKGKRDAVLVDAKFRKSFDFDSDTPSSLMRAYDPLLALGAPILIYLVTPEPKGSVASTDCHIYLNYCKFMNGKRVYEGWHAATDESLDSWSFYQVSNPQLFSKTTGDIIEPLLDYEFRTLIEKTRSSAS